MGVIKSRKIVVFLCLSVICTANILINPAIILEASAHFSTFLLSAEVQSVKDVADSILSQENIDAVSTIASDALTFAKSTIETAQNNIDVKAITDIFANSQVGSNFEGFLNANPDLKLSTSDYASTVTSSILNRISETADEFLTTNPDLTKSTSQYSADLIQDIYTNTITPKLNDVLATLDTSPLATSTRLALDKTPKTVESFLEFYNTKLTQWSSLKSKFSELSGPGSTLLSDFSTTTKTILGEKINENFDNVINKYPQLRQSTSEFTVSTLNNDVIPKLEETRDFLYNSPLGKDTRELAIRSTSDVFSSFASDVTMRLSPYTRVLGDVSNRLIVRATSPLTDFFSGFNTALQTTNTQKVSQEFINAQIASIPSVSVDISGLINENTKNVLSTSNEIVQNFIPTVQNIFSAVGNANIKLLSELGNAGNILGGNIFNLGIATGDVTGQIIMSAANTGGAVVASIGGTAVEAPGIISEFASRTITLTPTALSDLGIAVATSTADITERTVDSLSNSVESSILAVNKWKFFTDENHWSNGFWEQKITQLQNLKQSDFSNENIEKLSDETLRVLNRAGERFLAQYENSKINSLNNLGIGSQVEIKNLAQYTKNYEDFQSNIRFAQDSILSTTDTLLRTGAKAVKELNEIKDSSILLITNELQNSLTLIMVKTSQVKIFKWCGKYWVSKKEYFVSSSTKLEAIWPLRALRII